jgi:1,4-dihydroxy-2-naphthoate octaprenyltransferase
MLLAGSYPLTQVYQHGEDSRRGDHTLSLLLGFKGTFVFAGGMLLLGAGWLMALYWQEREWMQIAIFALCTGPVLGLFSSWALAVWQSPAAATFERTMRMNRVSSLCLSAAFMAIFIFKFL